MKETASTGTESIFTTHHEKNKVFSFFLPFLSFSFSRSNLFLSVTR